jgi:hypothetical protein
MKATIVRQETEMFFARVNNNFAPTNMLCNSILQLVKQLDNSILKTPEQKDDFERLLLAIVNDTNKEHHNYPSVEVVMSKQGDDTVYILPHVATITVCRANELKFKMVA